MSTYNRLTLHPTKKIWEEATWYDDFFGRHNYGVVFPSDVKGLEFAEYRQFAFDPQKIDLETKEWPAPETNGDTGAPSPTK